MTRYLFVAGAVTISLALATGTLTSCSSRILGCIEGSGVFRSDVRRAATENQNENPFTAIVSKGSVDVIVTQGPYSITVEGDDNLVGMVSTNISGRTLIIDNEGCHTSNNPLVVRVSLPQLESLSTEGSGDFSGTTRFTGSTISVATSGSGDIALDVEAGDLRSASSGSGDIALTGRAGKHTVALSGSGDLAALDLPSEQTVYTSSGSGDGAISVSQSLVASLSGSGDLAYRGTPSHYEPSVSGSGEISRIP
jgi:hypothetical protein